MLGNWRRKTVTSEIVSFGDHYRWPRPVPDARYAHHSPLEHTAPVAAFGSPYPHIPLRPNAKRLQSLPLSGSARWESLGLDASTPLEQGIVGSRANPSRSSGRRPRAEKREPRAENQKPRAEKREPRIESQVRMESDSWIPAANEHGADRPDAGGIRKTLEMPHTPRAPG